MAARGYSDFEDALATILDDALYNQINRTCPEVKVLPKIGIKAKNSSWPVQYGSATGQVFTDGQELSSGNYQADTLNDAKLDFQEIGDALQVSNRSIILAAAAGNPAALSNIRMQHLTEMSRRTAKKIATETWSGIGTSSRIHGLVVSNGALSDTGTYATLDRSSVTDFQGNTLDNSNVARPLTRKLLRTQLTNIFDACGLEPDLIMCDAQMFQEYAELFDDQRRWMQSIQTATGEVVLDAGEKALSFDGIPVLRTANCPVDANSNRQMAFINTAYVGYEYPLAAPDALDGEAIEVVGTPQFDAGDGRTGFMMRVARLSNNGNYQRWQGFVLFDLCNKRPNATGWLKDLAVNS